MSEEEIAKVSQKAIQDEFQKGRFTKMLSKKMRAKLDGKVVLHHSLNKKTAIFTEISTSNRKKVGYNYSVVNYFEGKGGHFYAMRYGIPYPDIYIFTGHFFDRLLERGMNNKDHAARMQAVFRLLRHMDRQSGRISSFMCHETYRAYMAAMGGLCLGMVASYKDFPAPLTFMSKNLYTTSPTLLQKPERMVAFLYITFVNKELLGPEQKIIYQSLLPQENT